MRRTHLVTPTFVLSALLVLGLDAPGPAFADETIKASLRGFEEVPAVSTGARGEFRGKISKDEGAIEYALSYEGLEGTVTQAHIHIGQPGVSGGISVWLCQTSTNPAPPSVAALTPVCPPTGTVGGILTEANVIGPTPQGILAAESGRFAELLRAIRGGAAYANVHSRDAGGVAANFTAGEIRGRIQASRSPGDD